MVTGSGAPRVGQSIAREFHQQGFAIVVHARSSVDEAEKFAGDLRGHGGQAMVVAGDVADETCVARWRSQVIERFGRIDVLVNSAAIWDPIALESVGADDFERYFRVNTLGTALTCQRLGLQMVKQASGGAIINIADWAIQRPYCDFAAYFPSKGAIVELTRAMAVELATRNPRIRVNAILPGPVLLAEAVSPRKRREVVNQCLLRREGTAEDVASAATFLATSPFITGVCLPVDGGRSIYAGPAADAIAHPDVR